MLTAIELVRVWLDESGRKQSFLARELGVSETAVSNWFLGSSRPTVPYRHALARLTGVPVDAWMTDEERAIAFGTGEPGGVQEAG